VLFRSLLYSGYYSLNLLDIFIASVFLSCSGAVIDLAMDIAATMDELKLQHPGMGVFEHMGSGLRVGRAVTGTMTTTLLLAYSGSHVTMFMVFLAKGLPVENLLNAPFVAAEVLNILVGTFGVVAVAPFTVAVAAFLYRFEWRTSGEENFTIAFNTRSFKTLFSNMAESIMSPRE
jgi:uncharacterized membrane protein